MNEADELTRRIGKLKITFTLATGEGGKAFGSITAQDIVNRLKNAIANVTMGQGPGVFPGVGFVAAGGTYRQRENVNAVKVRGIEASAPARAEPVARHPLGREQTHGFAFRVGSERVSG